MNLKDKFIATLDKAFGSNYDKLGPDSFFAKEKIKNAVNTETNKFPTLKSESKKKETKEMTSTGSSGAFVPSLEIEEDEVKKVEAKEATTSASSGQYTGAAFLAKSQSKKDWKPSRKKQWKGGQFVKIKDKCTKFPYCNQGIGALEFFENENIKESVKNLSRQYGLSKETIIKILSESLKLK